MSPIIEVKDLSKAYQISHDPKAGYGSLREDLIKVIKKPLKKILRRQPAIEEFWALKDVSFKINSGETVGIIGRNGAGKSTLLKVLSRITYPTSGTAILRGRVASLLEVGTGFHPELTGRENIFLNGAILGMSRREIERKFNDIVDFAEISKFLDTPVKFYSSGMYVRLAFAVAAHLDPDILVVDEVLSVGDAQFQKKSLGKMNEIAGSGRTVIFVSHNMTSVRQLCTRVIWLEQGSVKDFGEVNSVIKKYLSEAALDSSKVDISQYRNQYGNREIKIISIELLSPIGETFSIPWDQSIRLKLVYNVGNHDLKDVSFAIGAVTIEGTPIFTVRSTDKSYRTESLKANSVGSVVVEIKHNLRAGRYNLLVGVSIGNYVSFHHPTAAQLEISEIGTKNYHANNTGLINCRSSWRITGVK